MKEPKKTKDGKIDKRSFNRGKKGNKGGRPHKALELQAREQIMKALKTLYNTEVDEVAKTELVGQLLEHSGGQLFLGGHIFGKPTDKLELGGGEEPIQIKLADLVSFKKNKGE
jgi:hypothetical protein